MNRHCPACGEEAVAISKLLMSDTRCTACDRLVGVRTVYRIVFFIVTLAVTLTLGVVVLIGQGLYAAILIASLPVGAIGILKAQYSPLAAKS